MDIPPPAPPLRILVVDDESAILEVLSVYLAQDGHALEATEDGDAAWQRFQSGTWDLVLTDRIMPGMTGDQLTTAIKQVSPRTPIVMITGGTDAKAIGEMKKAGVDVIVRKPFTLSSLRAALAEARSLHFAGQSAA